MAKGDVVNGISVLAASAFVSIQPAAGVEYIGIEFFTSSQTADMRPALYDGTDAALMPNTAHYQGKLFITNTNYLLLTNQNAGEAKIGYCGVQIK